ncbi:MAG: hypothetical protein P4M15_00545, partial [Alphaproteobacteria bacterium]|nr:hypothetical protein [Alphaproteobacteria bacterium]
DYINLLAQIASNLDAHNYPAAANLANTPDEIRGYGHVKENSIAAAKLIQKDRIQDFFGAQKIRQAAE